MQPFLAQDLFQEEVRQHALAHEAPLEVREHAQDRVDLAGVRELLQLLHVEHPLLHHRPPLERCVSAGAVRAPRAPRDR